jgi:hypothetical protein
MTVPQPNRIVVPKLKPVRPTVAWCYWGVTAVVLPLAVLLWH